MSRMTLKFTSADSYASREARKLCKSHAPLAVLLVLALSCFALLPGASAQQGNTIATVAGGAVPNSVATQAAFPNPTGAAVDANGNIYIASPASYYVFEVNPSTGVMTPFAGNGIAGYSGDGGPATLANLSAPTAVAVDRNTGNVYIVDNSRIRLVNTSGTISTFANPTGQLCVPNIAACGDGGPATSSNVLFYQPEGIYVDGSSNIFISDTGDDRVRFINMQSTSVTVFGNSVPAGYITTVAGDGVTCNSPLDACGDGGPATAPAQQGQNNGARLDLAVGVATDSQGNLYIGDTRDQRVRCVVNVAGGCPNSAYPNPAIGYIVTYAGSGIYCTAPQNPCNDGENPLLARFHNPSGVWVSSTGNLYIADQWDNKIREVITCPKTGALCVTTVSGTGVAGFGGDGGKVQSAILDGPLGVVLDGAGDLTIADSGNTRIRQVPASTGIIKTSAGGGSIGDGGVPTLASLAGPNSVAWDATGTNYYIADAANNRIREVSANGTITTVAGSGAPTQPGSNGDGGSALLATLNGPMGVALDANGNIYIADSSNSVVRLVNMQSTPITLEKNITIQPGDIATVAGSGTSCEDVTKLCGDTGPATMAYITYPISVTLDGQNNLYLADYYDNRIRVVNLTTGIINTLAGTGNTCSGGVCGDNGPANKALLHYPYGIAADAAGDLYISDSLDSRVRCVVGTSKGCNGSSLPVGDIFTYAFTGQRTFSGDGGPATKATMTIPLQLALDSAGNLFVGGGADSVVQRIDAPSRTVITVAGNAKSPGAAGFGGDGGPSTQATLDNSGLSVSSTGELLIADQGNNRIRQVDMVPLANLWNRKLTFPSTPLGQTSPPLAAKLQNSGLASLPISSVQLGGNDPGDFAIVPNASGELACTPQLSPGPGSQGFCYVTVTFTPQQSGTRTATVMINTSLGTQVVNLSGVGQ